MKRCLLPCIKRNVLKFCAEPLLMQLLTEIPVHSKCVAIKTIRTEYYFFVWELEAYLYFAASSISDLSINVVEGFMWKPTCLFEFIQSAIEFYTFFALCSQTQTVLSPALRIRGLFIVCLP